MKRIALILLIGIVIPEAEAQRTAADESFHYKVKEEVSYSSWQSPTEVLKNLEEQFDRAEQVFSLWVFKRIGGKPSQGAVPYNRSAHFGAWKNQSNSCLNTRAVVLKRDSQVPVKMRSSGCTVDSGLWSDPYSGRDYRNASDIQIDHFVPLKNAYINGAHSWSRSKRCVYTNFRGDREHLLPVLGRENGSKSDRPPSGYMPPNRAYHCRYVANWLRIKFTWGLALSEAEKQSIENTMRIENCSTPEFQITASQVQQLRRNIADREKDCL